MFPMSNICLAFTGRGSSELLPPFTFSKYKSWKSYCEDFRMDTVFRKHRMKSYKSILIAEFVSPSSCLHNFSSLTFLLVCFYIKANFLER